MLNEEQKREGNGGTHNYNKLYLNKKQSKQKKISNKSLNQSTVLMRLKSWINNQMVVYTFTIFTILYSFVKS